MLQYRLLRLQLRTSLAVAILSPDFLRSLHLGLLRGHSGRYSGLLFFQQQRPRLSQLSRAALSLRSELTL